MKHLTLLAAFSIASASIPAVALAETAPEQNDIQLPAPPAGKSQVVWFRPGGLGPIIGCSVKEKGQKISSLGTGRYFIMVAEPGTHEYSVSSEATDTLVMDLKPDQTAYASCKIAMGIFIGRPKIDLSSEDKFRKAKKLKMVDADDMGPGEGALRPEQVTAALQAGSSQSVASATPQ